MALRFLEWRSCLSSLSLSRWCADRGFRGDGVGLGEGTGHGEGMEHPEGEGEREGVRARSGSHRNAPGYADWGFRVLILTRDFSPGFTE